MNRTLLRVLIVTALSGVLMLRASGPVAVYAIVEKVSFEPNETAAQRVQIWGAFSLYSVDEPYANKFSSAKNGYLYYRMNLPPSCRNAATAACAETEKATRAIWSDLQKMAGTGKALAFGGNIGAPSPGKVRNASEKAASPDPFPLGNPVVVLGASQAEITARLQATLQSK
jgi:hypothetical protein